MYQSGIGTEPSCGKVENRAKTPAAVAAEAIEVLSIVADMLPDGASRRIRQRAASLTRDLGEAAAGDGLEAALDTIQELSDLLASRAALVVNVPAGQELPVITAPSSAPPPVRKGMERVGRAADPDVVGGSMTGNSPRSVKSRRFRLFGLGADGEPSGFVDEGSAAELASRCGIDPSTVYRLARKPNPNGRWKVVAL